MLTTCCHSPDARRYEGHSVLLSAVFAGGLLILATSVLAGAAGLGALLTIVAPTLVAMVPRPEDGVVDGGLLAGAGVLTVCAIVAWLAGVLEPGGMYGPTGAALLVIFRHSGTRTSTLVACAALLGVASLVGHFI